MSFLPTSSVTHTHTYTHTYTYIVAPTASFQPATRMPLPLSAGGGINKGGTNSVNSVSSLNRGSLTSLNSTNRDSNRPINIGRNRNTHNTGNTSNTDRQGGINIANIGQGMGQYKSGGIPPPVTITGVAPWAIQKRGALGQNLPPGPSTLKSKMRFFSHPSAHPSEHKNDAKNEDMDDDRDDADRSDEDEEDGDDGGGGLSGSQRVAAYVQVSVYLKDRRNA